MLFNSIQFAIFLPIVFALYWVLNRNLRWQNVLLFAASYFFYAWWDWRFMFLLMFSTLLDFFTGMKMMEGGNQKMRTFWLWLSIVINLGFLGFFKYYNFFTESFAELLNRFGLQANPWTLKVILPVGISFYTFHGLSYVIDIYKRRIVAEKNFIDYAVFVSFFPLLVAGPIERATHLLPQIKKPRAFDYEKAADGMRQILWGLFKKIVIADNCAVYVNYVFKNYQTQPGSALLLGAIFFAIQIYGDFSGYTDIALGTARLFGIELLRNFNFPYFSRDIAEFWRRWHISLTTWFRDYVYIPLGGSRVSKLKIVRNTFIIFLLSGFWHGANWTFIAWGGYHAALFLPLILLNKNRKNINSVAEGRTLPNLKEVFQMSLTFGIVVIGWILFRAETIHKAAQILRHIFSRSLLHRGLPLYVVDGKIAYTALLVNIIILFTVEWLQRNKQHGLEIRQMNPWLRRLVYVLIILSIILFMGQNQQFIYFQF